MANKTQKITIDSILGGQSPTAYFSSSDQFRASLGIDPSLPRTDTTSSTSIRGSGLLRPSPSKKISSTTINDAPMWIVPNPKIQQVYVYDHQGSLYSTITSSPYTVTAISDGGSLSGSKGNGGAYYDNYIYLSKDTTIARYGPLDGTPVFDGNYWTTTLGKSALYDGTNYPTHSTIGYYYPFHVMHRHSDGKLYIADVVGGKGSLSYISTVKTTVEGDTDNGSTFNKISFGQNFWPSAIESYGSDLVVALFEGGVNDNNSKSRAKLVIWDTVSQNFNSISNDEFPDQFISSMVNVDGNLFICSGNFDARGFRVSQYVGGNSIQEVAYFEDGHPPFAGATDNNSGQLIFGSDSITPANSGCVYSIGLHKQGLSNGIFNIMRATGGSSAVVTAAKAASSANLGLTFPWVGWSTGATGGTNNGVDVPTISSPDYSTAPSVWWSQVYKVGRPFKITKIQIPLAQQLSSGSTLIPRLHIDETATKTLTTINSANYGTQTQLITIRPASTSGFSNTGDHSFFLELEWTGTSLVTVALPITIEYELLDIDTAFP